jgi:hypothetical protein
MYAHPGDWLIVERANVDHHAYRGRIEEVRSADGSPPYLVRWLDRDRDRTVLVFPGPDAHVLTPEQLERADAEASHRFATVQHEISRRGTP